MTFYESALRILEKAGTPLHVEEITKRSLDEGLLSHIGKSPELTMLARLAAMAKRARDRRLMVTAKDTFALTDWMLHEDGEALAQTGLAVRNPEEGLPPLRPTERHPMPRAEYLRSIGRQAERERKRRDDEPRKKTILVPEIAFGLLSEGGGVSPAELLARMKSAERFGDELNVLGLLEALAEDNQKRIDQQRRPQFSALKTESGQVQLSLETDSQTEASTLQAAFCAATALPFEGGRFRSQRSLVAAVPVEGDDNSLAHTARVSAKEARRALARTLRRKLSELELGTFEKACVRMLHGQHFRELKVAKRSREGALLTARRKEGSIELRYVIRMLKGNHSVERKVVSELRKDVGHYNAHVGLVLSAADVRGDARQEATNGALVFLWCGDGLSEKFCESHTGVRVTHIELFEIDDQFFSQAKLDGDEAQRRREERHREKERGEPTEQMSHGSAASSTDEAIVLSAEGGPGREGSESTADESEGEGGSAESPESAQGAEGRRKRKRRRRRRGGNRTEEAAATGAVEGDPEAGADEVKASAEPVESSAPETAAASEPTVHSDEPGAV